MPATFVDHELGPVESDIFQIFEAGRPKVVIDRPPAEVESFLERVWRRYARISVECLTTMITAQSAYRKIAVRGEGEVIPFEAVLASIHRSAASPEQKQTVDGRTVQKWVPRKAPPREPY